MKDLYGLPFWEKHLETINKDKAKTWTILTYFEA